MIYEEASLTGLFKIIGYFLLFSFLIRLIARMALPYVVKKSQQAMHDRMNQMKDASNPPRKEGDVTVQSKSNPNSSSKDDGEYVDFVEIKS